MHSVSKRYEVVENDKLVMTLTPDMTAGLTSIIARISKTPSMGEPSKGEICFDVPTVNYKASAIPFAPALVAQEFLCQLSYLAGPDSGPAYELYSVLNALDSVALHMAYPE